MSYKHVSKKYLAGTKSHLEIITQSNLNTGTIQHDTHLQFDYNDIICAAWMYRS